MFLVVRLLMNPIGQQEGMSITLTRRVCNSKGVGTMKRKDISRCNSYMDGEICHQACSGFWQSESVNFLWEGRMVPTILLQLWHQPVCYRVRDSRRDSLWSVLSTCIGAVGKRL